MFQTKKQRHRWALATLIVVIIGLLVGAFVWIRTTSTRQLPLGTAHPTHKLATVKLTGPLSQTADTHLVATFKITDAKTGIKQKAYVKMQWQGQSSRRYDKKNWKLKFYRDKKLKHKLKWRAQPGWQKQSTYVLKANYIDATQARNLVNAKLWSSMVATREGAPKQLADAQNNGAVTGFPVKVKANGDQWGVYTLNTAKNAKLWHMDKHNRAHMALSSNGWNRSDLFRTDDVAFNATGWTPDVPKTLSTAQKDEFRRLVHFVNTSDDHQFKAQAGNYLDVNSVIDMYLFTNLIHDQDGLGRNFELVTYNGLRWSATMYDMDSTWGLYENGRHLYPSGTAVSHNYPNHGDLKTAEGNRLIQRVVQAYPQRVQDRWRQLRKQTLTPTVINQDFTTLMTQIGEQNYQQTFKLNPGIPSKRLTSLMQVRRSIKRQFKDSDALFNDYTSNVQHLNFNYVPPTPVQ